MPVSASTRVSFSSSDSVVVRSIATAASLESSSSSCSSRSGSTAGSLFQSTDRTPIVRSPTASGWKAAAPQPGSPMPSECERYSRSPRSNATRLPAPWPGGSSVPAMSRPTSTEATRLPPGTAAHSTAASAPTRSQAAAHSSDSSSAASETRARRLVTSPRRRRVVVSSARSRSRRESSTCAVIADASTRSVSSSSVRRRGARLVARDAQRADPLPAGRDRRAGVEAEPHVVVGEAGVRGGVGDDQRAVVDDRVRAERAGRAAPRRRWPSRTRTSSTGGRCRPG